MWPGDQGLVLHQRLDAGLVVSAVTTTCHIGTHVDAPLHLDPDGPAVEHIPIARMIGTADVVHVPRPGERVGRADLDGEWRPCAPRVLVRTDSHPMGAAIGEGFAGLEADLVHWLAEQGVELVGIDTPSVDPFGAVLVAHRALAERGLTWIEGLWLGGVEAGSYQLVALPMPLVGAEAAPVRAVLRKMNG